MFLDEEASAVNYMKIFYILSELAGKYEHSASTTHAIELIQHLRLNNRISCFAPKPHGIKYRFKEITYIPKMHVRIAGFGIYQLMLLAYLIYNCILLRPDVFYARDSCTVYPVLIISKILKIPYILEVNDILIDLIKMEKHGSKISLIATELSEMLNYKYSDRIIAVTPNIKNYIKDKYKIDDNKIFIIENGSNIDLFSPKNRTQSIDELCLDNGRQYICAVCSFHIWQGIEYLIQAVPHILNECPSACLLIVGDGLMKEKWMQLAIDLGISDRVIFPGTIDYEKVPVYINASDVCVVYKKPLKSGYSPLKLYEYMACGKPVVASRVEGFEILEQNDAGITIEPNNPEELSKAIIKLLKDETLRYKMGMNGREYVINNHSWASVAKTVEEVCKNASEKHRV